MPLKLPHTNTHKKGGGGGGGGEEERKSSLSQSFFKRGFLNSDLKMRALLLHINTTLAHEFKAIILVLVTKYSLRHH